MKSLNIFIYCIFIYLFCVINVHAQVMSSFYDSGINKSSKGDYQGAITDFTKVIEQYPKEPKPYHYRGINKFNLKDYSGAIVDFNSAIGLNPKYADAYYMRGMAKIGVKKRKEACEDFQVASQLGYRSASIALDKYCH
ncbi:MAG: tetratricopeptide repeat protein [Bacteroidota bacterium]|jgi:lipoprotein NlpI